MGGGSVHIEQFVKNAHALGHELWGWHESLPYLHGIPKSRWLRVQALRKMDALITRIDITLPSEGKWGVPPWRWFFNFPLVIWEFNTHPGYATLRCNEQKSQEDVVSEFRKYASGCDLAICVSQLLADFVQAEIGVKRVLVVPNGSDPNLFSPQVPIVPRMVGFKSSYNLVWVGSGKEVWHDLDLLKYTAQLIMRDHPEKKIAFHLIGSDLGGAMAEMPENVFYWGPQQYRSLPGWLSAMDTGLILYKQGYAEFGSPLKLFDYLASGLSVVSTPSPFMSSLVEEFKNPGMLVRFGSVEELAEQILTLYCHPEMRIRLGTQGRQLVVDRFNWAFSTRAIFQEIEELLGVKGQKR